MIDRIQVYRSFDLETLGIPRRLQSGSTMRAKKLFVGMSILPSVRALSGMQHFTLHYNQAG